MLMLCVVDMLAAEKAVASGSAVEQVALRDARKQRSSNAVAILGPMMPAFPVVKETLILLAVMVPADRSVGEVGS
jgi:hypothetical protein